MAVYSSTIRYTGTSGIDTESLVRSLMNAESLKYQNLKAQGTKIQWKQEAYRGVADNLKSFQSTFLNITASNSLSSTATFRATTSSVKLNGSVSSAATVKTTARSAEGKHKLEVIRLADKDTYVSEDKVGGKITGGADVESLINKLDTDLGSNETVGFQLLINNKKENIELSRADITNIKGKATAGERAEALVDLLNEKIDAAFGSQTVTIDGQQEKISKASFSIEDGKLQLNASAGQRVVVAENDTSDINLLQEAEMGDGISAEANLNTSGTVKDILGLNVGASDVSIVINDKTITYNENTTVSELMNKLNVPETGIKVSFDGFSQKFKLEATSTGTGAAIDTSVLGDIFDKMGFTDSEDSHISVASDAIIKFDGILTTSSTNNFNISDIAITVNSLTEGETLDIEIAKDNSTTLDAIKKFVEGYNALIEGMNGLTDQSRAKSGSYTYYEPLTDDQKEDMTESEIEKWETKAKQGILNRDDILSGITSSMRSFLYESVPLGDGRSISLFEIGITTSTNYRDKGKLIIDEEKLNKALNERMEDVEDLFTKSSTAGKAGSQERLKDSGIADRLNIIVDNAIGSEGTISQRAGLKNTLSEFTSDMYKALKRHDEKVSDMLSYLTRKETYYYSMFSKMEAAMTQANSQASYLSSMLY